MDDENYEEDQTNEKNDELVYDSLDGSEAEEIVRN